MYCKLSINQNKLFSQLEYFIEHTLASIQQVEYACRAIQFSIKQIGDVIITTSNISYKINYQLSYQLSFPTGYNNTSIMFELSITSSTPIINV